MLINFNHAALLILTGLIFGFLGNLLSMTIEWCFISTQTTTQNYRISEIVLTSIKMSLCMGAVILGFSCLDVLLALTSINFKIIGILSWKGIAIVSVETVCVATLAEILPKLFNSEKSS